MAFHKNILLAVDLTEKTKQVVDRAKCLQAMPDVQFSVIYVIEPLNLSYGDNVPIDVSCVQEQIHERAKNCLTDLANELSIPEQRQILATGRPETEILRIAEELECDLIVLGNCPRSGLMLLLGSTMDDVIHGASCDVMVVHIQQQQAS